MKKTLLICLLSIAFQSWSQAQVFPIRGCADEACSEQRYQALMNSVAHGIYQGTGFEYNDSISLSLKVDENRQLELTKSFAWINEAAPIRYFSALKSLADSAALIPGQEFQLHWKQEFNSKDLTVPEIDINSAFPTANACSQFNRKAQLGCAKYVISYQLDEATKITIPEDELKAELHYSRGRLRRVFISRAPISQKNVLTAFQGFPVYDTVNFNKHSLPGAGEYHIKYSRPFQIDPQKLKAHIQDSYGFYIQNQLWSQLRLAIDPNHQIPEIDTLSFNKKYTIALLEYLEAELQNGSIPSQMWAVKKKKELNDSSEEKKDIPIYSGCDPDLERDKQIVCFQRGIMGFITQNFEFPEICKQNGQGGRIYVEFRIEEDGSISTIEVNKKSFPLLDIEGIRVISILPNFSSPIPGGKITPFDFILPINAKLQ
ncbi:energy transducer TonB [Croceimicrobium hydrocarbonivorans]|uniref:Energy transducer TonB n=1 Tax=Croceimicrobium hydrocarbonivorans TaxID=2761580 RepID=A0A7H0VBG5_9FLAO|nr:energy transducer TonB [Croceimicrobium hydrocarbonivorans]QNR23063.1 energy transducer TonB [Croceimicrobium hydrocarbonivorans]